MRRMIMSEPLRQADKETNHEVYIREEQVVTLRQHDTMKVEVALTTGGHVIVVGELDEIAKRLGFKTKKTKAKAGASATRGHAFKEPSKG
jgi:hypothetical protein